MIRAITVATAAEAYKIIINHILDKGRIVKTEDNSDCMKTDTIISHILRPMLDHDRLIKLSPLGPLAMEQYRKDFVEGVPSDDPRPMDFSYTDNKRLFHYDFPECYDFVDQIQNIVEKLMRSPGSRRAVAVTWMPWEDIESSDPPCLSFIKVSISQTGEVNMSCVFRSHDMLGGFPNNCYALAYLQKYIADKLHMDIGYLEVVSMDPHIYFADQDKIDILMGKLKNE